MSDEIILAVLGIVGGLITFLQKVLYNQGKTLYDIVVKLIDRFNKSDERLEAISDQMAQAAERRHEKIVDEMNDMTDTLNYIKGRINSKSN
jgi:predicted PurR-regulated permease PerM|tara:strand:- start:9076 stop:9348 length:273 start_codon:yes stop_codon:yes gene_type:complete